MRILFLAFCCCLLTSVWAEQPESYQVTGASLIGGAFSLTDHTGAAVTEKNFQDKYMLVFFGFTNCPSVCPLGLSRMIRALKQIDNFESKITPVFITVDPERDTPERMTTYLGYYHSSFVGLTGSEEQLEQVKTAYRAYSFKSKDPDSDNYSFDHSSMIYLMGKQGQYITHFSDQTSVDEMSMIVQKNMQTHD